MGDRHTPAGAPFQCRLQVVRRSGPTNRPSNFKKLQPSIDKKGTITLHPTLSHLQQSELDIHDCNPERKLFSEGAIARMEDLNRRSACFWCSGQDRQPNKNSKKQQKESSNHGFSISFSLSLPVNQSRVGDSEHHKGIQRKT